MSIKKYTLILAASMLYFVPAYALQDLTGTYKCTGIDSKTGSFKGFDTMQLDKKTSTNKIAGYAFSAPEFEGGLSGFAVFDGKYLAIDFHSLDKSTEDSRNNYGVILAHVTKNSIKKIYYEPVYKGGSTGTVECIKISNKIETPKAKL